jgi:APA family basic amino acid/polyamine antiporter
VALGELPAWFVGWTLILEYTVVCSVVAVGWSGYAAGFMRSVGLDLPEALIAGPAAGGVINLPAIVIALAVAGLLALGSRESATVNMVLVFVKLLALATFIALTIPAFDMNNFEPFAPHGFGAKEIGDAKYGMMGAAALIFFAFYGFDAVSTAAEEAKDPGRDLKIGIVGSMVACTLIYMVVAAAAIGSTRTDALAASSEPLAMVLRTLNHPGAARWIGVAAVVALPTVIMAFMYGQSRIFFVMARDGLLPQRLSAVNETSGTPVLMTMITGVIVAIIAGFLPLQRIAEVANAGTLVAFMAVAVCMLVLRNKAPTAPRPFRTPAPMLVALGAIVGCAYLFASLPRVTIYTFLIWNAIGIAVYFVYARFQSALARA